MLCKKKNNNIEKSYLSTEYIGLNIMYLFLVLLQKCSNTFHYYKYYYFEKYSIKYCTN